MHPVESPLDTERQEMATEYARLTRRLSLVELVVVGALLLALVLGGVSARLSHFLAFSQPWASALYFVILVAGLGIIVMPVTYYQGFVLPRRYGLSRQGFRGWLTDGVKAAGLGVLLALAVVIVLYLLLARLPGMWWPLAAALLLLLSLLLTWLTPTLLLPLFIDLQPLEDGDLRQRLMQLAKRAGTEVRGVFTMELSARSTTANAMLAGLGSSRRIILSDTLLEEYSPEEVEVILAHELGHHVHRDIPKLVGVQTVFFLLALGLADLVLEAGVGAFGFQGIADVAAFPLLLLTLGTFGLAASPLLNGYIRHLELLADETALQLTDSPRAFITAMAKLTDQNLSVAQPSWWVELLFYDHPPYTKRVNLASRYLGENA